MLSQIGRIVLVHEKNEDKQACDKIILQKTYNKRIRTKL